MKNVLRSLFVVLSLVSVLMVVGCKTENNDPTKGRVIEAKYRGKYTTTFNDGSPYDVYLVLSEKKMTHYYTENNSVVTEEYAWTVGKNLYHSGDYIYGFFTDDGDLRTDTFLLTKE